MNFSSTRAKIHLEKGVINGKMWKEKKQACNEFKVGARNPRILYALAEWQRPSGSVWPLQQRQAVAAALAWPLRFHIGIYSRRCWVHLYSTIGHDSLNNGRQWQTMQLPNKQAHNHYLPICGAFDFKIFHLSEAFRNWVGCGCCSWGWSSSFLTSFDCSEVSWLRIDKWLP